jgi:hypothetical protein
VEIVYFSHSYQQKDSALVRHFEYLITNQEIICSLDPPSERIEGKPAVNSAKLERHVGNCDGMISVLTARDGGVSPYIMYEINLALRARKPLLVFVEDTLPDGIVPSRILQRRFNRRSVVRQIREHQHAINILRDYIGRDSPKYQPPFTRRSCLIVGSSTMASDPREAIAGIVDRAGYSPKDISSSFDGVDADIVFPDDLVHDAIETADVAVCVVDDVNCHSQLLFGAIRWAFIPMITLTANTGFRFDPKKSTSLQPRIIDLSDPVALEDTIGHELRLLEENLVDIADQEMVREYVDRLVKAPRRDDRFVSGTRNMFQDLIVGNKYTAQGNAAIGAMGNQPQTSGAEFFPEGTQGSVPSENQR